MDCEAFREQMGVDPGRVDAAFEAHESQCPACAAWAQRARRAEALIHRALRFDTVKIAAQPARRSTVWGSLAAAAIAGLALWFGLAVNRPAPTQVLVAEILAHMNHEPHAVAATNATVSGPELRQVLAGEATIDIAALTADVGPVTYANKCVVAGQWMSHLVVQSGNGPVTVLLIPEQSVDAIVPLELRELELGGSIVPAGRGAVAIVGQADAADAQTARRVADTVQIRI